MRESKTGQGIGWLICRWGGEEGEEEEEMPGRERREGDKVKKILLEII